MTKNTPRLVTILTTTYNHERFIAACIESVLRQTYRHWEMIIVDDGSTDGSPDIIRGFSDPRIHYHRLPHRGIPALREMYSYALQQARGELVGILSGDDEWPADRLARQVPTFKDDRVVICFGRGVLIDEDSREIGPADGLKCDHVVNRPVGSVLSKLLVHNFVPSFTNLIRKSAIDALGGFVQPPGVTGVDSPTCLNLALLGEFRYIDTPLGFWRVHRGQHTGVYRLEQARSDAAYALEFFRTLPAALQRSIGWTEETLTRHLDNALNNAHFEAGRRLLLAGNAAAARASFWSALRVGAPATKAKALIGLACSAVGTDIEALARLCGRPALR